MGPRVRRLPLRRDHVLQPDAASTRQASRSIVGRDGVVSAANVRARPRTVRLASSLREPGGSDMDGAAKRQPEILTPEENHPALNALLGANPFVGLDATQVLGTLTTLLTHIASQPTAVASRAIQLSLELGQIAAGVPSVAPEAGDRRFGDPAWTQHPLYHRMMQTYLAWRAAMHDLVNQDESVEWKEVEQQKFAVT